jgi:hypothetical protein
MLGWAVSLLLFVQGFFFHFLHANRGGLSTEQRELLHGSNFASPDAMDVDKSSTLQAMLDIPAGDEGAIESGAGGELEVCQELLDEMHSTP